MFDLETYCIVRDLMRDCQDGGVYLNIRPYLQRFALNTTLTLCYGIRMDSVWDGMLREVLEVGSAISLLRSASENYQDYIPCESRAQHLGRRSCGIVLMFVDSVAILAKQREDPTKQGPTAKTRQVSQRTP